MADNKTEIKKTDETNNIFPLLPLRNTVLFPQQIIPVYIGRKQSLELIDSIQQSTNKYLVVVAQKDGSVEVPSKDDLYTFGTLAKVMKVFDMPDKSKSAIVQGISRVRITEYTSPNPFFNSHIERIVDNNEFDKNLDSASESVESLFRQLIDIAPYLSDEQSHALDNIQYPSKVADKAISLINISPNEKQEVLEELDVANRLEMTNKYITREIQRIQLGEKIQTDVQDEISKSQKEYYLREQLKAIQKELGDENLSDEMAELEKKIKAAKMPPAVHKVAKKELARMNRIPSHSPEYSVSRTYIDWLIELPWSKSSKDNDDVINARNVLDNDHYGLDKAKERIVEHLAVRRLKKSRMKKNDRLKSPILCFTGPPGTGKTSIGKSIATAMGREFVRISLGGVRDEAEIRGHRRTYIGALPGRIITSLKKAGTNNPIFVLDEIDKLGMDFRGDPSSALLEVLDPEQNFTFNDHYLEVDFDLSEVMFVCTANSLNIPAPLLDRMEVIRLPGYTEDDKLNIAKRYLIPKQMKNNGVEETELKISDSAVLDAIRYYTREAGVRNLERELANVCRKIVKKLLLKPRKGVIRVNHRNIGKYLGVQQFRYGRAEENDQIGQVTGLAWTEGGGELLTIEAAIVPGKGKLIHTGQLGDVMKESIQAAMTVARSRADMLGIDNEFQQKNDVHIHVPEGATPKDGPSAGIGMCAALVSALTKIPAQANVAMTGEITLRGEVLPIGGLKEKLLAARRGGIDTVLIPAENKKDLVEIPKNIKDKLNILLVKWIDEVFELALQYSPVTQSDNPVLSDEQEARLGEKETGDAVFPH